MPLADFHIHSIFSRDSWNRLGWMLRRFRLLGMNCIGCTDHNTIRGALELARIAPFRVVVGEEVDTGEGEIIGLFLESEIKPGLGMEATMKEIRSQRGIVYLPHPLAVNRRKQLCSQEVTRLREFVDVVETFNSRTLSETPDRGWLDELLSSDRIVKSAGSDAHSPYEIGNVLIRMDEFHSPESFLESLRGAHFSYWKSPFWKRLITNSKSRRILRRLWMPS